MATELEQREQLVTDLVRETTGLHRYVCLSGGMVCTSGTRQTAQHAQSALEAHALAAHRSPIERRAEQQDMRRRSTEQRADRLAARGKIA